MSPERVSVREEISTLSSSYCHGNLCRKQLDVELVPLELKLIAWVEIKIQIRIKIGWFKVTITIFHKKWKKTIWHWTSSALRGTVWKKISRKDDQGPPRFPYCKEVDQEW